MHIPTANDALWAGSSGFDVFGLNICGTVAASLLRVVGLGGLATHSLEDYEALALRLARDRAHLSLIKAKLARKRTTYRLFDTARFTRHIETAYVRMWQIHRACEFCGGGRRRCRRRSGDRGQ